MTAKKTIRQTNLIHMAGTLDVSKLIARESGTAFEKCIQEPLLTGLVVFVNRYMFYGGFQGVEYRSGQKHHIKPFVYSE